MFPIGASIPADNSSLTAALAHGLAPLGVGAEAISLEGEFPQFNTIRVLLSGAEVRRGLKAARPAVERQSLCFARRIEVTAHPLHIREIPVTVDAYANDAVLAVADAADGAGKVLVLDKAGSGRLELRATRKDLEAALLAAGEAAARSKGAEVKSVELVLQNETPRVLAIRAVITAKAMFFTTTVTVSGRVEVDDELNARLCDLDCEGDGMVGKMAAGALRGQFQNVQDRAIPLGGAIAGLRLSDVSLSGGEELCVRGVFGAAK